MPKALPRVLRSLRRAVDSSAPAEPAGFFTPTPVDRRFCSTDDRAELRKVQQERRRALSRLRRTDRAAWRAAP